MDILHTTHKRILAGNAMDAEKDFLIYIIPLLATYAEQILKSGKEVFEGDIFLDKCKKMLVILEYITKLGTAAQKNIVWCVFSDKAASILDKMVGLAGQYKLITLRIDGILSVPNNTDWRSDRKYVSYLGTKAQTILLRIQEEPKERPTNSEERMQHNISVANGIMALYTKWLEEQQNNP